MSSSLNSIFKPIGDSEDIGYNPEITLPDGWMVASFDDVTRVMRNGTSTKQNKESDEGFPVSRIETIATGEINYEKVGYIKDADSALVEQFRLRKGDVLLSHINSASHLGKTAIYSDDSRALLHGMNLMLFRLDVDAIDPKLFHYYCNLHRANGEFSLIAQHAVNQASLNQKKLKAVTVPLAPRAEQKRIVSAIESLQERSSRTRALLEEVKPLIAQLRQSVLRSAFSGRLTADWRAKKNTMDVKGKKVGQGAGTNAKVGATTRKPDAPKSGKAANTDSPQCIESKYETAPELLQRIRTERRKNWETTQLAAFEAKGKKPTKGWQDKYKEPEPVDESELPELPEGWCWVPLELIATHESGFAFKSKCFSNKGVQVIKLGNLYQGNFDLSRDPAFLPSDHPDTETAVINVGDILVSQTGTRHKRDYGFFVRVPEGSPKLLLNQRVMAIRPIDNSLTDWIIAASQTDFYRDHFFSSETGGVNQGNVGVGGIMRGPIPLACSSEMKEVDLKIRQCFSVESATKADIESIEQSLTQLDQSILSKAFRGELVPQDPNDEPAAELLARIRATREAEAATKKAAKKKSSKKTARKK